MVLFFTAPTDPHARAVAPLLEAHGVEICWFHLSEFPGNTSLSLEFGPQGQIRWRLLREGEAMDLSRVTTAWLRRPGLVSAPPGLAEGVPAHFVELEASAFVNDFLHTLAARWVPASPWLTRRAEYKARQLQLAADLGLEIPPTLMTNDPALFLEFYRRHEGQIVSKNVYRSSVSNERGETQYMGRTRPMHHRALGYASSVQDCPVLFQAYVPKRLELRITVVGQQVFPCEIHSQATTRTKYDWRNYDLLHTPHRRHELPACVEAQCIQLVERLGLTYGAIDMVLTPDGRYVFLEINPNGQYLWIEELTGMPISQALADILAAN